MKKICEQCGKEYEAVQPVQQKYCGMRCKKRSSYLKNIEAHKQADKIKIRKQTIGLAIRDEHLITPNDRTRWLWDGIGKWSVKYWPEIQECLECGTNIYKHSSNGICVRCYNILRSRDEEKMKKYKAEYYQKQKESGKAFSGQQARNWIKKAKNNEIPITPKISNLLDNLERL